MAPLRVHVLYEYGKNYRPHASSSLRLIQPLTYPTIRDIFSVTFGTDLTAVSPDIVMVDRLWRPDICPELVYALVELIKTKHARLILWLDDNFRKIYSKAEFPKRFINSHTLLVEQADAIVLSSEALANEYSSIEKQVIYLQSALDERLIIRRHCQIPQNGHITIGYMGSHTHHADLSIIQEVLIHLRAKYGDRLSFECVGALNDEEINNSAWKELRIKRRMPWPEENEYPLFMLWFTSSLNWDIALAPLVDEPFNACKSDIKFLDYTAASMPGIYSKVQPYSGTIIDHQNGILVDNSPSAWEDALIDLIDNPKLRLNILNRAEETLYTTRILKQRANNWVDTIMKVAG